MANSLIAFALVAKEFERTGDAVRGLTPLFAPIIAERGGQLFEPAWFAERFTALYGYRMGPVVAQALIERLVESGLLIAEGVGSGSAYRCKVGVIVAEGIGEREVMRLTTSFVDRAKPILQSLGKSMPSDELRQAFLDRMAKPEFTSIFLVHERAKVHGKVLTLRSPASFTQWSTSQAIDFLTADFVLHLLEASPESFDELAGMAFGALVADAVSALAVPGQSPQAENEDPLRVVIDGPLLLDALNVNSPEHYEYAIGLLKLFKDAGLRLATFDHILTEMDTLIRKTLEHFQAGDAYGPLAAQLRLNSSHRLYATYIANTLDEEVRNLGVSVLPSRIYEEARFAKFFPKEERENSLRNALGDVHHQIERRMVDAKSIATVIRLKGEKRAPSSVLGAGTIFVTRNSALARKVNSFLAIGGTEPDPRFTCLSDGQLAGLLWFIGGSSSVHISRMRLIASCASAVTPRMDVITEMADTLEKLNPKHREQFMLLMQDKRASLCPMRRTAGFASEVSNAIAESTLEEMRVAAAEPLVAEVRTSAAKEIELLRADAARNRSMAQEQERRAQDLQASMAELETESENSKSKANLKMAALELTATLAVERARMAEEVSNTQKGAQIRAVAARRKAIEELRENYVAGAKWILRIIYIIVVSLSLLPQTRDRPVVIGGEVFFGIIGLWLFTPYFERLLERASSKFVISRIRELEMLAKTLGLSADEVVSTVGVASE